MKHLFCFGLGYSATNLAKQLVKEGWRVSGTCRTAEKCESLRSSGITAYIFDNEIPLQEIWDLQSVTHIIHSIPPSKAGDSVITNHFTDIQNLRNLEWLGYLSTTGVYGNHRGGWVDEQTLIAPPQGRGVRRAEAERTWLGSDLPVHIFRLSGIYGKGRSAVDELRAGTAHRVYKEGQVFSRIHVEDIAQILRASISNPNVGSIYNCADDEPAPQADVVEYAAGLLGVKPPKLVPFEKADLSEMAYSFWMNNRRVRNDLIKNELGVQLKYPNYREGLRACL